MINTYISYITILFMKEIGSTEWFGIKEKTFYSQYGRSINLSVGLILGFLIDKALFILTKGLSVAIPPFSVMLMTKGKVLCRIRFDKKFNKIGEKIISHFVS